MTARDEILSRLPLPRRGSPPEPLRTGDSSNGSIVDQFQVQFQLLGGKLVTWKELEALKEKKWIIDSAVDRSQTSGFKICNAWEAEYGLTRARAGIAESGSVLLLQGTQEARLASLVPPIHVVLLTSQDLLRTLDEAMELLSDTNATIITGPSRTADIEGVLVRGVHGPAEIWLVLEE